MIPTNDLVNWLEKIIYLIPSNVKINLNITKKGKESSVQKKYKNKDGLYDYIQKLSKKQVLDPIHFMKSMKLREVIPDMKEDKNGKKIPYNKEVDRFIGLEVAFTFNSDSIEFVADSFCNFVNTIENGVHVDAVKQGILQYLSKQTKDSLSERESKKLDITFGDITNGLVLTVYLSTDMSVQFASQTKEKVSNPEFFKPLRDMTYKALEDYFRQNSREMKKVIDYIKMNAKARIEANKVRNSVIKGETSVIDDHMIDKFCPANNTGKDDYREIYIMEGDSAKGTTEDARDPDTQALFPLRGVPLNSFSSTTDQLLKYDRFKELISVLKCNIGEKFDIEKLWYKKIIIMTDSDVDGNNITSLICTLFLIHMPEIIERGMLYKAVAPLYWIRDKDNPFIITKKQFIEVIEKRVSNNTKIIDPDTNKVLTSEEVQDLLLRNRKYLDEVTRLSNHFSVHPNLIEFVVQNYDKPNFSKLLNKQFTEMTIDKENVISGVIEGKYQILQLTKSFEKRAAILKEMISKVNNDKIYYRINEIISGKSDEKGIMSLTEFFKYTQKFIPEIEKRYKGLGELSANDLWETTMNPNKRILIQLTLEDVKKEVEKFRILHGNDNEQRKSMMSHFKIDREDLDN